MVQRSNKQSLLDSAIVEFSVEFSLKSGSVELPDLAQENLGKANFP